MKKEGEKLMQRKNGNYFYYFGETKRYRGTGLFYIRSSIMRKVLVVKGIFKRISVLKIEIKEDVNMTMIQVRYMLQRRKQLNMKREMSTDY